MRRGQLPICPLSYATDTSICSSFCALVVQQRKAYTTDPQKVEATELEHFSGLVKRVETGLLLNE